jgi:hypothetical protein
MRCWRLRDALHLLACLSAMTDSDPKARSALRIKDFEEDKSIA